MKNQLVVRQTNGRFTPGSCGNPRGRPPIVRDVRELARTHTAEAIETLVGIMRDNMAPHAARGAAAQALLDRGWGRPTVRIESPALPYEADQVVTGQELREIFEDVQRKSAEIMGDITLVEPEPEILPPEPNGTNGSYTKSL